MKLQTIACALSFLTGVTAFQRASGNAEDGGRVGELPPSGRRRLIGARNGDALAGLFPQADAPKKAAPVKAGMCSNS